MNFFSIYTYGAFVNFLLLFSLWFFRVKGIVWIIPVSSYSRMEDKVFECFEIFAAFAILSLVWPACLIGILAYFLTLGILKLRDKIED